MQRISKEFLFYISYKTAFDLAFENNFDEVAKILLNRKILM